MVLIAVTTATVTAANGILLYLSYKARTRRSMLLGTVDPSQNIQQDNEGLPVPASFRCPITQEIMQNPVTTVDGHSYEKEQIRGWFQRGMQTSPLTNLPLASLQLVENMALKQAIDEYIGFRPELARRESLRRELQHNLDIREAELASRGSMQDETVQALLASLDEKQAELMVLKSQRDDALQAIQGARVEHQTELEGFKARHDKATHELQMSMESNMKLQAEIVAQATQHNESMREFRLSVEAQEHQNKATMLELRAEVALLKTQRDEAREALAQALHRQPEKPVSVPQTIKDQQLPQGEAGHLPETPERKVPGGTSAASSWEPIPISPTDTTNNIACSPLQNSLMTKVSVRTDSPCAFRQELNASSVDADVAANHLGGASASSWEKATVQIEVPMDECSMHETAMVLKATHKTNFPPRPQSSRAWPREYLVDKSRLQTSARGLKYRLTKRLDDHDNMGDIVVWGASIKGIDQGDGWLKVGERYLPMEFQGIPVLKLQGAHEMPSLVAGSPNTATSCPSPKAARPSVFGFLPRRSSTNMRSNSVGSVPRPASMQVNTGAGSSGERTGGLGRRAPERVGGNGGGMFQFRRPASGRHRASSEVPRLARERMSMWRN